MHSQTLVDQIYREAATITGKPDAVLRRMAVEVFAAMLRRAMDRPDELVWTVASINGQTTPLDDRNRYIPPGAISVEVDVPRRGIAYITGNRLGLVIPGGETYVIRELTDAYAIAAPSQASPAEACVIFCTACAMVSHNPHDVRQRYCGRCRKFHRHANEPPKDDPGWHGDDEADGDDEVESEVRHA